MWKFRSSGIPINLRSFCINKKMVLSRGQSVIMLSLRWTLVLLCLSPVFMQRMTSTLIDRCTLHRLQLVKDFFKNTEIVRGDSSVQYCKSQPGRSISHPEVDLSFVIDFYRSLHYVNSYTVSKGNDPVVQYGVLSVSDKNHLPLYVLADIRRRHLRGSNSYPTFGDIVTEQMELMGQVYSDDTEYLLAYSLGGDPEASNIFPMARNVAKHLSPAPENADLGVPGSYWRSNEDWIRRFLLRDYPDGRILWRIAVQYEDGMQNYRPLSFALQFTAYTNQYDNSSVYFISPQMTYLNNNDVSCSEETYDNQVRSFRDSSLVQECGIRSPKRPQGTVGSILSQGQWGTRHKVSFTYTIQDRTYFYGQSILDGRHWFIQELLPNGEIGRETSHGLWNEYYSVVFPFFINGRQYFYGHSSDAMNWFIQELLPGGRMGEETDHGIWATRHRVSFAYTISGRHFFYGQSIIDGTHWFIQELLPGGRMGAETSNGLWNENYQTTFPFAMNGRQFFYGHNIYYRNWFIQELLPGGKMGLETDHGEWTTSHQVSVPYAIDGRQFYFGQSVIDGNHWFIQELLPNGKMGDEISHGLWGDGYSVMFPYIVDGKHFLYGHSTRTRMWFTRELF